MSAVLLALAALSVADARADGAASNAAADAWHLPTDIGDILRIGALIEMALRPGGIALAAQGVAEGVARCDDPMIEDIARGATADSTGMLPAKVHITAIRDIHEVSASWIARTCRGSVRVNGGDWRQVIYEIHPMGQISRVTFTVKLG